MNTKLLVIVGIFVFSLLTPSIIQARPGCCSSHSGVCGCGCCDGSPLSATCLPYYPWCIPQSTTQSQNNIPDFPQMNATWNFSANVDKTYNIDVKLDDPSPSVYSAVLNKCLGCDPGPNVDFYANTFYFTETKPGKYYLNVKKQINSIWSKTSYWIIDVPTWTPPTPTPVPTIKYVPAVTQINDSSSTLVDASLFWFVILTGSSIGGLWWYSNLSKKKKYPQ